MPIKKKYIAFPGDAPLTAQNLSLLNKQLVCRLRVSINKHTHTLFLSHTHRYNILYITLYIYFIYIYYIYYV